MDLNFDLFFRTFRKKTRIWNVFKLMLIKQKKYFDKFLALIFSYPSRCYQRVSPLEIKKIKVPCKELVYFSKSFGRFSSSKTLIGKVTDSEEDFQMVANLIKCACKNYHKAEFLDLTCSEILAKVMAYRNLRINDRFEYPFIDDSGRVKLTTYFVDKVFDQWNKHVAFGLLPDNENAAPILLFRGTDFTIFSQGGRASILSDLDPDGPGKKLFLNSKSVIRKWLQKHSGRLEKPRVIGYSLGGCLAAYTAYFENDLLNQKTNFSSIAFNLPGVENDLLNQWDKLTDETRPAFKSFITRGDVVSKFGSLFGDVYEVSLERPLSPVLAHEHLIFSQPIIYVVKIDTEKENLSPSRSYYSKIQRQSTSLAYRFGLKLLLPNPFDA